ncbi:MAG: epoxyqueuosine reductase QueH [Oscillospiraceae bacterium]|nr:epoxyqueuosine reductase QueH [Oscillospiraceae bacterium]MBR6694902.1 epoxyqueuosine reductase QueH [Oscillospiraceae bacterium]
MAQNVNYQKELDKIISEISEKNITPTLLLHSCCAPCSSYVLTYLAEYFKITVFYYNPNIYPESEYAYRVNEVKRLIEELPVKNKISFIEGEYNPDLFFETVKGLENEKEGGERCFKCYDLRIKEASEIAKKNGFDYYTTTLSISPHKNAEKLNEIGEKYADENTRHLPSDFKKKNGFKESVRLSEKYNLYRQNYCGCVFSKRNLPVTE